MGVKLKDGFTEYTYLPNSYLTVPTNPMSTEWYNFWEVDANRLTCDKNGNILLCYIKGREVAYQDKSWSKQETINFLASLTSVGSAVREAWSFLNREFSGYYDATGKFYHKGVVNKRDLLKNVSAPSSEWMWDSQRKVWVDVR